MSELYIDFNDDSTKLGDYSCDNPKYSIQSENDSSKSNYSTKSKSYQNQNPSSSDNLFAQAYSSEGTLRMSVQSITHQQFPEFTHFFVCITRVFNLVGCSMRSLLLKIRILPSLPIIETNTVWCIESEVNFRCGYAFDFKNFAKTFNLGDYTPVVEFYRKIPNNDSNDLELFAFSLLPLSVFEITECAGYPLTYLMKNHTVSLHQFTTGQIIGYITVTIALGYQQQQQFIDPDKIDIPASSKTKQLPNDIQQPQNSNHPDIEILSENEEENDNQHHKHRRHRRHHRKNNKKNAWIQKAMAYGWKQPGYVDPDWKDKAIEKGWIPPNKNLLSSIGITCTPSECPNLKDIEIQQVAIDIDKQLIQPHLESSTATTSSSNEKDVQSDDSTLELFNLMNKNTKNNKNKDTIYFISDQLDSEISSKPILKATNVVTLFDKPQLNEILSLSNDDDNSLKIIGNQKIDSEVTPTISNQNSSPLLPTLTSSIDNDLFESDSKILKQKLTSDQSKQLQRPNIPSNTELINQSINSIINSNISKIKKEIEDSDDSFDDNDLNLNATTIQILKDLNISINKLNGLDGELSQSSDSNAESDLDSHSSIDPEINKINIPKQIKSNTNFLDSNSLLDSDSVCNSNSDSDSDSSNTDTDNFLNLLGKKDQKFTNILNILNGK